MPLLSDTNIQAFINTFPPGDVDQLLLSKPVFDSISNSVLVQQIIGKHVAQKKFPTLNTTPGILFPPKINLEQASSETTAKYKAGLISGHHLVDISCGFGIDSMQFAKRFKHVLLNDPDHNLLQIVKHNFEVLGINTAKFSAASAETLQLPHDADWWYADPSRRVGGQRKLLPQECVPDLHKFMSFNHAALNFMVKYSPMLDIQSGLHYLPQTTEIQVVSVEGECKELLFIKRHEQAIGASESVNLYAADILKNGHINKTHLPLTDLHHSVVSFGLERGYLYEPNAAVLKAGAFNTLAVRYGLKKADVNTHLYTGSDFLPEFPGYIYRIAEVHLGGLKQLKLPTPNCHVISRNYPLSSEALSKQLRLTPSGEHYLFACTLHTRQKALILAVKIA